MSAENKITSNSTFIDITVTGTVKYMAGIQRVVSEMAIRLTEMDENIFLGEYDEYHEYYRIVTRESFIKRASGKGDALSYDGTIKISDMPAGLKFVDMDSVWNNYVLRRQNLYRQLKGQGVIIGAMVYDIIPVSFPQYCHRETTFHFLLWLSAVLEYADFIMVNTDATRQKLKALMNRLGIQSERTEIYVAPLGADFGRTATDEQLPDMKSKYGRYLLMVGTLEPRKNHRMLVRAMHGPLKDTDVNLVIAGRIGWNMEEFLEELKKDPMFGNRIIYLQGPADAEIRALYADAFAVVIASFEEGYGIPIIEAFHYGKPVLASDLDVFREVGGECGVYFRSDDEDSLAEKVRELTDDTDRYRELSARIAEYKAPGWNEAAKILHGIIEKA